MFGSLRKKLEEITAQVNPFDGGKTASTVRASRQQAPPAQTINRPNQSFANKVFDQVSSNTQADQYRRQQQQRLVQDSTRGTDEAMRNLQKQALTGQVDKNVAAAKIRALGTSNVQPNTAENVLKPTTPAQIAGQKVVDTTMNRKVAPVALGVGRSAAGTVRGVSGLYDLASPGDGVNRISKQAVKAGETTDQVMKDNSYNQIAYKGAQAATDLATFGVAGRAAKAVPGVSSVLTKVDDLAKPVSNVSTKLATKGFGGRVAGATLKNVANPRYQAANAGFTALEAGKQSANGQQVTPMGVTTNLVAGGVGFPVAGAVVGQTAKPVINAGVNQLRKTNLIRPSKLNPNEVADLARLNDTAKTGAIMEDGVYQRGVQAAQKAGVDYNNPTAVDDLLGKHRTFDTVSSQRKQAIDEAKARLANPRPLASNEGGYIRLSDGKEITPKKYKEKPGYAMSHRPNEGPRAFNLTEKVDGEQMIPDDMYTQWYGSRNSLADKESIQSLKAIKDNPEADVVIYRASPKDDLAHGDWVTLSKDYATQHAEGQGGKVHSYKVKAKDLKWAMDDVNEFGFYPEKTKTPLLKPLNNEIGAVGKNVDPQGAKPFETLPADIHPSLESKAVGVKRIAPDRVPHQQLTVKDGIEKMVESEKSSINKRAESWLVGAKELENLQKKYGDSLPVRTKANIAKYPDLQKDFGTYSHYKKYSYGAKNVAEIKDQFIKNSERVGWNPTKEANYRAKVDEKYRDLVKKDISKGYRYPDEVLSYDKSFKTAIDNRARYEKGLATSFSSDDSRIIFDDQNRIAGGLKRQDGKELTPDQKEEMVNGILQTQQRLGVDIDKLAKENRWVFAHLNGKNPFLTKNAAGLYRGGKDHASVSVGGTETFSTVVDGKKVSKRVNTTMAHELGHALDLAGDKRLLDRESLWQLRNKYNSVEGGFRGSKYWNSEAEMTARAISQYVEVAEGSPSAYTKPGNWNKDLFDQYIKPSVEKGLKEKYPDYQISKATNPKLKSTAEPNAVDVSDNSIPQPQPVGKDVNKGAPKSPFEKDLQSAGLTGNKAVRPKENTVQTPKNQSQSTPKTEQPVTPQLAETTNQTKAPQTKGRATSSELGQGEKITSGTPKRTASQSPEVKSNIVNPSIRERGFVETIIDDPKTSPKVKENLSSLYSVRNTKQLQTKAANLVKTDPDLAMRVAREDTSDIGVATGSELIKKLQQDGNYEQAIDLATNVAETLTRAGQTSQAASIYGKLTPEGILRFTQKEINAYNKATKKNIKLSPEQAKSLTEKAQKVQEMPEGRPRDIATQEMLKELYETMPSTWVEKVSTFQTMAQLLNPKTLIRNLGGNTIFSVLDNSSQVLATGIDKAISGVKGTPRTTTLPSIKTQAKGLKKGFNEGYEEAVKGINLGPRTQFELNDVPVFRDGLLGKAETGLNLSLRATDRAAYTAAFDDTLKGLMKTNKAKTATTEMIEIAHHQGLYRTFQDESNAAKIFVGLKKALNIAGFEQNGKRWGLGDLILKYPKTPGNLIARGIDYSPVGILKGMINLTQLNQGAAKQQAAANSIARGVTGTGSLIGTGYVLAGLGLITEKPEDNKDLRNLQKSAGLGGYQLNTSGLRRFLLSGFDTEEAKLKPGDKLVSYDWAQPAAIPLSMGASMGRGEGVKKGASQGLNALSEGVETLAEQPLVRGVQQFFGSNKSAIDSVIDTAKSAPASFVPTLSNQVRQLTDNTTRNTSDPSALKEAYNKAINRVPGIAGQLPAQVDTLGNDKKNFQNGSNNPFNVFLNPSFVNKYQPNNVATTNLDLNRATGETKQLPNTVSNKVKINGQDKVLTGKEQGDYQRFVGQTNSTITDTLTKNPRFNALPDSQKVNLLASMQTDINNAAKVNLFGDNPEKLSESVDSILSGNVERAIELKLKTQEKTVEKKSGKKVAKAKSTKKKSSGKKGGKKGSKGKAKKGKFDYTKNLFASTGTATSGSVSKSLRAILENAQKSSSKK